jgi:DNA-binding CsgD family transcriptional regulator
VIERAGGRGRAVIGRDEELVLLRKFAGGVTEQRALLLEGGPGIGKTTLWEAGVELCAQAGARVLQARLDENDSRLSYAALGDLLDGVTGEELAGLPEPQRLALEVALLRTDAGGAPPERRAVAAGLRSALRALAAERPLLVAIDDVHWVDAASVAALGFAARRLDDDPVRFLLTRRPDEPGGFEAVLDERTLKRLALGPLSVGALRRIIADRLELRVSRRVLRLIFDAARGNPLFGLELARAIAEAGAPAIGEEVPLSETLEDVLGARLERLPPHVRRMLLAVALTPEARVSALGAVAGGRALEGAVDAGVVVVDGDRIRASHPLLAAVSRRRASGRERRELHLELARGLPEGEARARQLALGSTTPDEELARTIAAGAATAFARGATVDAVELGEHALRLVPPSSPERGALLLNLAEYVVVAGEPGRVTELLSSEVDALPRGPLRGRAWLLLADAGDVTDAYEHEARLDRALVECDGDPAVRAIALATKAANAAVAFVERVAESEAAMVGLLPSARAAGPEVERHVLHHLAWARALRGHPVDDLRERFASVSADAHHVYRSLDRIAGVRLGWRGEVGDARRLLKGLIDLSDERGEEWSSAMLRLHLCEVELRAGELPNAAGLLEDWEPSDAELVITPVRERCLALLAAGRGHLEETERLVARALASADRTGIRWDRLESLRASGMAALLAGETTRAAECLGSIWDHIVREGVEDPGAFPVAPDLVDALTELGRPVDAVAVVERLGSLASAQAHPWGLVTTRRCRALLLLSSGEDVRSAATALAAAADDYGSLGLRFDRARTLFSLGRRRRRARQWGDARAALEEAAAAFDQIGGDGWAAAARSELDRVGARRPGPAGALTPAERRVARLAAAGHSNAEIAQALVVSVHTVERHLTRTYAKLGIRSRSQLAGRLF